jgi:protein required for attachment to host cells
MAQKAMRIRVLVADQSEADFYDLRRPRDADLQLNLVARLVDEQAHLHDRDLKSDRPGRFFDHAPLQGGRRGATAHHATGGERRPRRHAAEVFAGQIAAALHRAQLQRDFDHVIVMAGPAFLGLLREALPDSLRPCVLAEVAKDLVHGGAQAVREHLPESLFAAAL